MSLEVRIEGGSESSSSSKPGAAVMPAAVGLLSLPVVPSLPPGSAPGSAPSACGSGSDADAASGAAAATLAIAAANEGREGLATLAAPQHSRLGTDSARVRCAKQVARHTGRSHASHATVTF